MSIGVLGLGSIGIRHAKNLINLGHEVVGFDPDESRQSLLSQLGGTPVARDKALSCDKVVVASPTPQHYDDLKEVRCPTLAEKPLADRPLDFNYDHVKMVGYNLRFHSCVKQAKDWLKQGLIGNPLHGHFVCAQFNDKPAYLRDGVTLNWSHEIDLALYLLGLGDLVGWVEKNQTRSDLMVHHKSSCVSSIHLNYINRKEERYFDIIGDKGKIHCVLSPYRWADAETEDGTIYKYAYHTTYDEDYIEEMKAFLADDYSIGCSAFEAAAVLRICLGG